MYTFIFPDSYIIYYTIYFLTMQSDQPFLTQHHTQLYNNRPNDYSTRAPNERANSQWYGASQQLSTQRSMSENNVITPPESVEELSKTRSTFLVVDSRNRNHSENPEPNAYTVPLPHEIRDVKSIQLVSYDIPKPQFPVRSTNNVFHLTNAEPTIAINADGTQVIDLHKTTSLQSVSVDEGYYSETVDDHVSTNVDVNTYKAELLVSMELTTFKQDMLSSALEAQLNCSTCTTCIVYIEEHNNQYTVVTNFSNALASSDSCDAPYFFHPFFEGCEEFYGSTTTERVNVSSKDNPVYEHKKIGKKQLTYLKNSIAPIIGHPRTDPSLRIQGKGNNLTTLDTLNGVGTTFTVDLRKGDWVYIYDYTNNIRKRVHINEVISDTECTIDCDGVGGVAPGGPAFDDAYMWVGRLTLPWVRNLQPDPYIGMHVRNACTLHSYNQAIDRAYFIVPAGTPYFNVEDMLPFKSFSPVLGRMDKLTFSFKNADGTLYDFKGRDHVLQFKIIHYRQNIKYGDF